MAIKWNPQDVGGFLQMTPNEPDEGTIWIFEYEGRLLKYSLWVHVEDEMVSISGDDQMPFGSDSLFEVYVPCNLIRLVSDGYYPGQRALEFRMVQLMKRPGGDLKVWPQQAFPDGHPTRTIK